MNSRTAILITSGVAVAALIALVVVVYAAGTSAGELSTADENGSLLDPHVQREARDGYVIAELYQDVRLDMQSGVYDRNGVLQIHHWTHDDVRHSCSIDLVLAVQEGLDQTAPTAMPRPPATMVPYRPYPEGFTFAPPQAYPPYVPVQPIPPLYRDQARPSPTHTPWPTPTPYPTPLPTFTPGPTPTPAPYPTATPSPLISSVSWIGWENRPIAFEADGIAVVDVPRGADVSAHLSLWTGAHPTLQSRLATLPLPDAHWENGQARIRLQEASGRILLDRDHVDARHRSARLRIDVAPLSDCGTLHLRWEKPAAVVVRALTDQPYADWGDHELPPSPIPAPATLKGLTLTGMNISPPFDPTTTSYTASVPYVTSETTVRPVLADPDDGYVINLVGSQESDGIPALVQLATGANVITIAVTSVDGNAATTYTVTVSRETPSTDARLAALMLGNISPDRWTPAFDPAVREYDVHVPHSTARISVLTTTADAAATFKVATAPVDALIDGGYGTALVDLAEGATTAVTITVTAEDGATTQGYVVRIHRAGP